MKNDETLLKALKALGDVSRTEVQQMYEAGRLFRHYFTPQLAGMAGAEAKAKWTTLLADAESYAAVHWGRQKGSVLACLETHEVCRLLGQDNASLAKLEIRSHELRPFAAFLGPFVTANGFNRGWRVPGVKPEELEAIGLKPGAALLKVFERIVAGALKGETAVGLALKEELSVATKEALAECDEHTQKEFLLDQEQKAKDKAKAAKQRAKQKAEEAGYTVGKAVGPREVAEMLINGETREKILLALAKVAGMAGLAAVSDDIERLAGLIEQAERKAPQTRELAVA